MIQTEKRYRWIAHMDLDAFFASCEQRDHPEYRARPLVVGALPGGRGVVAAASYEARKFGIHSAMPINEAYRRCPHAVYLRPDMSKYRRISRQVFTLLDGITPCIETASIDEAYLDISGLEKLIGSPETIGEQIKRRILSQTGLTASVGIGTNRLIAKLASEYNKPDGLTVVYPDQVDDFLAPMPVSNLRGLGRKTEKIFQRLGIKTVAQLRNLPLQRLEQHLGKKAALSFHRQASGIASDKVISTRQRKSISKETTFATDVRDDSVLRDALRRLSSAVAKTARQEGLAATVVTLKIRFADFETHTRQYKRSDPTADEREIFRTAWQLFEDGGLAKKPVRLIGAGISQWQQDTPAQADLFAASEASKNRGQLLKTIDAVNAKFGEDKLHVGVPHKSDR